MNLLEFLAYVDNICENLSENSLRIFVHETARTLPEEYRSAFLSSLELAADSSQNGRTHADCSVIGEMKVSDSELREKLVANLKEELRCMMQNLTDVNQGKKALESEYNEEWDDWYNSDDDEILFSDPHDILKEIELAAGLIAECIHLELYDEGLELAELLSLLEVSVNGDYAEYADSFMALVDMELNKLLTINLQELTEECLYLSYMANPDEKRAEEMMYMLNNFGVHYVSIENILQMGHSDLPAINDFLLAWMHELGKTRNTWTEKMACEAQNLCTDREMQLANARLYAESQPALYMQLLNTYREEENWEELIGIGEEAIQNIPEKYTRRSEAALLTAEAAVKIKGKDAAERYWVEAFRSNTNSMNYLRIRFLASEWKQWEKEVKKIYEKQHLADSKKVGWKLKWFDGAETNYMDLDSYCIMLYFDRQLELMEKTGMRVKEPLGWSSTFMKEGMALLFLLLCETEDIRFRPGLKKMCRDAETACGFHAEKFFQGTDCQETTGAEKYDENVFWSLFCQWKKEASLPEDEKNKWMKKLHRWTSMRTEAILEGNHTNYYYECAAFIAALGEVEESMGDKGAKQRTMLEYKRKYPRRRKLHQELRSYGMID